MKTSLYVLYTDRERKFRIMAETPVSNHTVIFNDFFYKTWDVCILKNTWT